MDNFLIIMMTKQAKPAITIETYCRKHINDRLRDYWFHTNVIHIIQLSQHK